MGEPRTAFPRDASSRSHLAKACGQMRYTGDLELPGRLIGKALRSPYPHCLVNRIDPRPAMELHGVRAVLTARDIPGINSIGKTVLDQEFLVSVRARTVMDALALVAAESEEVADAALNAIELDLTPLPAVFDPEAALAPGAPQLYPSGNLLSDFEIVHGNAAEALRSADIVVENTYQFPWIEHAYIETEGALAAPEEDGTITVWLGCHNIYGERQILSQAFDWPEEQFRIILAPAGGSFGGKDDNLVGVWTALLALRTGRPVGMIFSRAESLRGHSKRHSQHIQHRLGARANGELVAAEVSILSDTGAYAHWGPSIMRFASLQATGPYRVPHARVRARLAYTNNLVAGAMRGWGTPGVEFAIESQMDELARRIGMHPLQLRWLNALRDGDNTITGTPLPGGCRYRETLAGAARAVGVRLDPAG